MPAKRPLRRRRKPPTPRWWKGRRLTAYGREAVSVLVLVGTLFLRDQQAAVPVAKREEEAPPDIWVVDVRTTTSPEGLSKPMPSRPAMKDQLRPPCNHPGDVVKYTEVSGACWLEVVQRPPCGELYEHTGRCFVPVRVAERPPTSFGK